MKIGKVYANAEREEDRANQTLIEMGMVAGAGLLGEVVEAVQDLATATQRWARHPGDGSCSLKLDKAWLGLFATMKAIETQSEKTLAAIEEARYAMIGGKEYDKLIPVAVVGAWLANIEEATGGAGDGSVPASILQCMGCGKPASSLTTWTIEDEEGEKIVWLCGNCQSTRMLTEAQGRIEETLCEG